MKKIKKFKIKQNSNNEYSNYHYFIPKSEHIKFADARTLDTEIGDLRNQINELEEKTQYLIDKAPLIGFEEGESSLSLRGCANDEIRKVGIDGNSFQQTYVGYNLLPYPYFSSSKTENGLTFTDNKDGTVSIKGTSTAMSFFYFYSGSISDFQNIDIINNKNIVLKELSGNLSNTSVQLSLFNMDNSEKSTYLTNGSTSNIIVVDNQSQRINSAIIVQEGATIDATIIPMLVFEDYKDTNTYEPYTGGQPSPNPDYPQNIEVIDEVNLLSDDNTSKYTIGPDGSMITTTNDRLTSDYIKFKPNENFYLSCNLSKLQNGLIYFGGIAYYDKDKTYLGRVAGNNGKYITGSTPNNTSYIRFFVQVLGITDFKFSDYEFMLVKGTIPKPYLLYDCIGLKQSGKNMFVPTYKVGEESINCVNSTLALQGDEYTLVATGKDMYFGEVVSAGKQYRSSAGTLYNVKGKSKVHLLLTNNKLVSNYITAYDSNKNSLGFSSIKSYRGSYNIPEGAEYITLRFGYANATAGETYKTKVMLSFEEINNIFKPYHEPKLYPINLNGNSLAKAGDIKDLLKIYRNGDVEIKNKIGKVILNGSENWTKTNDTTASVFALNNYIFTNSYGANGMGYCNYFIYQFANKENLFYFGYNNNITICMPTSYTLDNFKTWLSTHNTEIYYQLAEPQIVSLPNIEPIELWEGTNNFELITNLDTTMRMIYKKDINALIADSGV